MNKTGIPPSGSKHDYMTLAPYLWPNPDTPNGLPYIRKDGEVNPETRDYFTDFKEKENFFNAIDLLGKAFYFSGNKAYGEKAIALIRTWFLDEATKMNPHLNYGQGVRGESDGRRFGIIDLGASANSLNVWKFWNKAGYWMKPPKTEAVSSEMVTFSAHKKIPTDNCPIWRNL